MQQSLEFSFSTHNGLELDDLRLSQFAPTNLSGLPVAENGLSRRKAGGFLTTNGAFRLYRGLVNSLKEKSDANNV
jgi:hypothetical protein